MDYYRTKRYLINLPLIYSLDRFKQFAFDIQMINSLSQSLENPSSSLPKSSVETNDSKRVKVSYSNPTKDLAKEMLKTKSLHAVFLMYNRKIPRATLWNWSQELNKSKSKKVQGRKTKLSLLEEELFLWFIVI